MKKNIDVSICLFAFNSSGKIEFVLDAIFKQKTNYKYEVIVIDSGSTDNTLDILKKYDVRLKQIPNSQYGHGKTRNLAISLSKGEYVIMMVDDAIPATSSWLNEMIKPYKNKNVMAVFGKHLPKPGAAPFIARDIESFFASLTDDEKVLIQFKEKSKREYSDFEWGRLIFFSDVNSSLRKDFALKIPYADVSYSEDQIMGKNIIEKGYKKAYSPKASVLHSHTYPTFDYLLRYFDEFKGLKESIGYVDSSSVMSLLKDLIRGSIVDLKYIVKRSDYLFLEKIGWMYKALIYNLFRRMGSYLAAREEKLPVFVRNFLSLEYHKKKKVSSNRTKTMKKFLMEKYKKSIFVYKKYGVKGLKKLFLEFFKKRSFKRVNPYKESFMTYADFETYLNYLPLVDLNKKTKIKKKLKLNKSKKTINWIIPDFGIGSGGHINIFRFVKFLEKNGFSNNLYFFGKLRYPNAEIIKMTVKNHFQNLDANFYVGVKNMKDSDVTIATSWQTAYPLYTLNNTKKKMYFVQDFEPDFFNKSSEYYFAENTYKMGFNAITAGEWLSSKLSNEYKVNAKSYLFASDDLYKNQVMSFKKYNRVFFYSRPPTERRGFNLGIEALKLFSEDHPEVEIVLAGWDDISLNLGSNFKNLGLLKYEDLPDLYSSCDAGLIVSLTNCSLIPIDLMASSCATISTKGENNSWLIKDGINGLLSDVNPQSIASQLATVYNNEHLRRKIIKNGYKLANTLIWDEEYQKVIKFLE